MKHISANGRVKVRGSFTPNFDYKYDKVGERIMRELQANRKSTINPKQSIPKSIVIMLIRLGVARKTEVLGMWLVEPTARINYEPKIGKRGK